MALAGPHPSSSARVPDDTSLCTAASAGSGALPADCAMCGSAGAVHQPLALSRIADCTSEGIAGSTSRVVGEEVEFPTLPPAEGSVASGLGHPGTSGSGLMSSDCFCFLLGGTAPPINIVGICT